MYKKWVLYLTISIFCQQAIALQDSFFLKNQKNIVLATKQIELKNFPLAYNPSIFQVGDEYLLLFRFQPNYYEEHWVSQIGIVTLNEFFDPISEPQILNTRSKDSKTPSQAEDARLFSYKGGLFVIYNDNIDKVAPWTSDRRDMFMAELLPKEGLFSLSPPLKLFYTKKYASLWQKNWVPFEWNENLLIIYSPNPHEILYPNLINGECYLCYDSWVLNNWKYGKLRGSAPPLLVDGQYLTFFHSGMVTQSPVSKGWQLWHYFMGAYTFKAEPPFEMIQISPEPIVGEGFYTESDAPKRVIFPGGFVVKNDKIFLAYGKDDREIWIATLDKKALLDSLVPVER